MSFVEEIRPRFPQLKQIVHDERLVYLDSAATTLKPLSVIQAVQTHMSEGASNVHRGAHFLSDQATEQFEETRELAAQFIGAESKNEIVFTRGTTEGLNLLAQTLGATVLRAGDEIILSQMEHHSNIVPWQMVAKARGVTVRFIPVLDNGELDYEAYKAMLSDRVKIVSLVHLSNALGTLNPISAFFKRAHEVGAVTVADVAQSAGALPLSVKELSCDFMVFSGHKMFGPTGVGVLFGKMAWLEKLPPYQGGGSMISEVTEAGTTFLPPPHRFEAGTPAIAEVIGLGAAFKFMNSLNRERLREHESTIMKQALQGLAEIDGLRIIGYSSTQTNVISFLLEGSHPSDVGAILDEQGIAVRAGHHCCQPLMRRFSVPGTVRASFSIYSSSQDVQDLVSGVMKAKELLL